MKRHSSAVLAFGQYPFNFCDFLFFLTYYIREGRHEERSSGKTFLKEDVLIFKLEKGNKDLILKIRATYLS